MAPENPLPHPDMFASADEYIDSLLQFASTSTIFQTLCGGVHILDFFTGGQSLYHTVIPQEWRSWLMACETIDLLDLLMRDDLDQVRTDEPPESLIGYIKDIRNHSLNRTPSEQRSKTNIPRHIAVGMIPKKIHEVSNFADYVVKVSEDVHALSGKEITHFIDFGSGQNYLGRTLASPSYNKSIVAVESKQLNIAGAKHMDVLAKVAEREKVMRNKKLYRQIQDDRTPMELKNEKALRRTAKPQKPPPANVADLRPRRDLETIYTSSDGKGYIQYVEHIVEDGDLSNVVAQITQTEQAAPSVDDIDNSAPSQSIQEIAKRGDIRLMAISIHSCGNLSHHGIRSIILNPSVHAIAIVGCCYNLLTERLGPPTYKLPLLRTNLRPTATCDPHGFPMSERVGTYDGEGIRFNITARMMAVQAPQNWTKKDSDGFFKRHYYRALLQKVFLDYGIVSKSIGGLSAGQDDDGLHTTDPVIVGSLRKGCYVSFTAYVRGALTKLISDPVRGVFIEGKMGSITDEEIGDYARRYDSLQKELSVTWTLMSFSAGVVESLIVVDRWLFLREHKDLIRDCWVEPVFDYRQSPRNLVVVGIKR